VKTIGNFVGAILVGIGAIWCGQGAGYISGSFMTDDRKWMVIGAVVLCFGVGLLLWTNYRDRAA
jgi:hypothetical protein